jgi:hypothetical protein
MRRRHAPPMNVARLVRFALGALAVVALPLFGEESNGADLRVETRTTTTSSGFHAFVETRTVYVKGARLRIDIAWPVREGSANFVSTIARCDERRTLRLNADTRTYAFLPVGDSAADVIRARVAAASAPTLPRGADVEIRIDAVDTGERRRIGSYETRRVITTRWIEPTAGAQTKRSTTVTDGWYIDLPSPDCRGREEGVAFLAGFVLRDGNAPDVFQFTRLRTARTGYAIEQTERSTDAGGGTAVTRTELIDASDAPLAWTVFDVPDGYRRALPLPGGGFDLNTPDTPLARLASYYEFVSGWFRHAFRRDR